MEGIASIPFSSIRAYADEYIGGNERELECLRHRHDEQAEAVLRLATRLSERPKDVGLVHRHEEATAALMALETALITAEERLAERDDFFRIIRAVDNKLVLLIRENRRKAQKANDTKSKG